MCAGRDVDCWKPSCRSHPCRAGPGGDWAPLDSVPPLTTSSEPQDSMGVASAGPSTAGWRPSVSPVPIQALAVWVAATVAMTWRVLSWTPRQSPDAWAYLAWGQALLRGERPLYNHALTTPKPLGLLLGMIAEPLPPDRGFQLVVIVLLGAM